MTEQNLSLDETIELARKFNEFGLWELIDGVESQAYNLMTMNVDNVSMYAVKYADKTGYRLCATAEMNEKNGVMIADYFVSQEDKEKFQRVNDLFSELYSKAGKNQKSTNDYLANGTWGERTLHGLKVARKLIKK